MKLVIDNISIYRIFHLKRNLAEAGFFGDLALQIFLLVHLILPIILMLSVWLLCQVLSYNEIVTYIFLMVAMALGLLLPLVILFILRRRLRNKLAGFISLFFELVCICSEFGLATDSLIKLLSDIMHLVRKDYIANFMDKLVSDLSRLPSRELAWVRFQGKIPSPEFVAMIKLMAHSDLYGVSMLAEQRQQLDDLRELRVQRIEIEANKAISKVSMTLIFSLIPTMFILGIVFAGLSFKRSETYQMIFEKNSIAHVIKDYDD